MLHFLKITFDAMQVLIEKENNVYKAKCDAMVGFEPTPKNSPNLWPNTLSIRPRSPTTLNTILAK